MPGAGEIWAYGLRNPWRISFVSLTGDLYVGDVDQNGREVPTRRLVIFIDDLVKRGGRSGGCLAFWQGSWC